MNGGPNLDLAIRLDIAPVGAAIGLAPDHLHLFAVSRDVRIEGRERNLGRLVAGEERAA